MNDTELLMLDGLAPEQYFMFRKRVKEGIRELKEHKKLTRERVYSGLGEGSGSP